MQSLKTQAKQLGSEPSTRESAPKSPDIAALAERFVEPLRGETVPARRPAAPKPPMIPRAAGLPQVGLPPKPPVRPALSRNALVAAVVVLALIPLAILIVQLWQDMMQPQAGAPSTRALSTAEVPLAAPAEPKPEPTTPDVALSSPERIEAGTGEFIIFPIAIDATKPLPPRSIVAVTGLPQGASFSEGRPFGKDGWSLSTEEIAGLRLRLPAKTGIADLRLELVAGDGSALSQSKTQLSVMPPAITTVDTPIAVEGLAGEVETAAASDSAPEDSTNAEQTASIADLAPPPQRKPSVPASSEPDVKVNKVKAVAIAPPGEKKPYDGAYALGAPADEPGEWMETKTAVDMHAKAEQKSDTVKVAQGGLKVQVKGRDKNWIQVHDPKSGTTGWIYNRFLKETDTPAN